MALTRDQYFVVQQIYAGWWLFGVVVMGALVFTALLALAMLCSPSCAFLCILATQAVFWTFTYGCPRCAIGDTPLSLV